MLLSFSACRRLGRAALAAAAAVTLGVLAAPQSAHAGAYAFKNIVDDSGMFTGFMPYISINNSGRIAFIGFHNTGYGIGVFTSDGTTLTNISGSSLPFVQFGPPSINNYGNVAFQAYVQNADYGIYIGTGSTLSKLYGTDGLPFSFLGPFIGFNDYNTVVFEAGLDSGGQGLYTGNKHPNSLTQIVAPTTTSGISDVAINNAGTVAFLKYYSQTDHGIYVSSGGQIAQVAHTGSVFKNIGEEISFQSSGGHVAFLATLQTGVRGIFVGRANSPVVKITDDAGEFQYFSPPRINANGEIVFNAVKDNGERGIYIYRGGQIITVIKEGDALFGSTVTDLEPGWAHNPRVNDNGTIAFHYSLANGREGIGRAAPRGL